LEFRDRIINQHGDQVDVDIRDCLVHPTDGFKKKLQRWGTRTRRRSDELNSVNQKSIEIHLRKILKLFEDVPLENIWNLDETALQFRITSSCSYVTITSDGRGVRGSKELITVTLIVSAAGEKLILQVIRKSKCPRALKGIDILDVFNISYQNQSKAWQDVEGNCNNDSAPASAQPSNNSGAQNPRTPARSSPIYDEPLS
jgi:hypothetical protein